MNNLSDFLLAVLGYVVLGASSAAFVIGPLRRYLFAKPGVDGHPATPIPILIHRTVLALALVTGIWWFRLAALGMCCIQIGDYWADIQFNSRYPAAPLLTTAQLSRMESANVPRYVRLAAVFPSETGAVETETLYYIPTHKNYIYAALPVSVSGGTDSANVGPLRVFVTQNYNEGEKLTTDTARSVSGLIEPNKSLDFKVRHLFEDDGYTLAESTLLIKEGVLPLPTGQLYALAGLAIFVSLIEIGMLLRGLIVKEEINLADFRK